MNPSSLNQPDSSLPVRGIAVDFDPFSEDDGGAAIESVLTPTGAQREIWLACQQGESASLAYNEAIALRLDGRFDPARLQQALDAVVDAHESLRCSFSADGVQMIVQVAGASAVPIDVVALSELAPEVRDQARARHRREVVSVPFNLVQGPLLRARLLVLASDRAELLLSAHHIVCDGYSFAVLVQQLAAALRGESPAASRYRDYVAAEAERNRTGEQRQDIDYWLGHYRDGVPTLDLPGDRPRAAQRGRRSRRQEFTLDAAATQALRRCAGSLGISLFTLLQGGFALLLGRLTRTDDVVVGIPAAGQSSAEMPGLVGHCVNLLPIRQRVTLDTPAATWLKAQQTTLLDAFDHQRFSYGTLLEHLPLVRDPSRLPLVATMFNLDQAIDPAALITPELSIGYESLPRVAENFELFLNVTPIDQTLRLECQFATERFDDVTIDGWLAVYARLLEAIVASPELPLGRLPLLPAAQARQLDGWNDTARPDWTGNTVTALLEAALAAHADSPAVSDAHSELTGQALLDASALLASQLVEAGIGHGSRVGLCVERSVGMVVAQLAILRAGAAFVPLDPGFPQARLADMCADAQLPLIITDAATDAMSQGFAPAGTARLSITAQGRAIAATAGLSTLPVVGPEDAAYMIYTSGSTGRPKGVVVPHRAVANLLRSIAEQPGTVAGERLLAVTTLSFDIAMLELLTPLICGATVVVASRDESADGDALLARMTSARIDLMQATPGTWRLLLAAGWQPQPGFRALVGGEPLPLDLAQALRARGVSLWNLYGPTETTIWSTRWDCRDLTQGIRIGQPLANTRVMIRGESGVLMPIGFAGEIEIGGEGVTLGYHDRPELTADRFVPDEAGGWAYRTGDLGRWRFDGTLEHLGRLDHQVKVRGYRIELGEIEAVLACEPSVSEAVVVVQEANAQDQRLVGFIQATPAVNTPTLVDRETGRRLRDHLRQRLPDYMLPQHLVQLPALPRLPNGKIDRKGLPLAWQLSGRNEPTAEAIAGSPGSVPAASSGRAPQTPTELRVAAHMAAVLRLAEPGADEDFFLLGGHSLLAAQLAGRLAQEFKRPVPLATLFGASTIARLAAWFDETAALPAPRIIAEADRRTAPLSLMQQRVHFLQSVNPDAPTYNTPSAHRLRGPIDGAAFERAFNRLIERQASLRTVIETDDEGRPRQRILDASPVSLFPAEALDHLEPAAREAELAERMRQRVARPMPVDAYPLFDTRMYRLQADEHVWFFMPHHIIWDGWSFDLLYAEMSRLYSVELAAELTPEFAAANGEAVAADAPLPLNYGDFAAWQRAQDASPDLDRQVARWTARLDPTLPPLQLPADRPRPARMSGRGSTEWLPVGSDRVTAARALARAHGTTQFVVLLAAYVATLHTLTGQNRFVIGTPVRNREHPGLESIMGFFVNALPLSFSVSGSMRLDDLLAHVRSTVLEAFDNPEVPMERLVQALGVRPDESRSPLWQTFFSWQEASDRPLDWGNLRNEPIYLLQPGTAEDLGLWFLGRGDRMTGGLQYNTDIFERERIIAIGAAWCQVLDRMTSLSDATTIDGLGATIDGTLRRGVSETVVEAAGSAVQPPAPANRPAATPVTTSTTTATAVPAPRPTTASLGATEQMVAVVWAELLGQADIRPDDNFFDLGGHSMLVMQAMARLEKQTGKRINPRRFIFESLAQVARAYDEATVAVAAPPPAGLMSRLVGAWRRRSD